MLKHISRELNLPVKVCGLCGISYIPDHRTKGHQKCCPYGCVELNRRINKEKAKSRYRKKKIAAFKASEHNGRYRQRKRNGQVLAGIPENNYKTKDADKRLRNQIKYFYKKLNRHAGGRKVRQLDRILRKISNEISAS